MTHSASESQSSSSVSGPGSVVDDNGAFGTSLDAVSVDGSEGKSLFFKIFHPLLQDFPSSSF